MKYNTLARLLTRLPARLRLVYFFIDLNSLRTRAPCVYPSLSLDAREPAQVRLASA